MVRAGENRNPQSNCKLGVNPACLPTVVIDDMFYYLDSTYVIPVTPETLNLLRSE